MLNRTWVVVATVSILTTLSSQTASAAQKTEEQSQPLKVSIVIASDTLTRQKPAYVTITVENTSGQELDINSICSFKLLSTRVEAIRRNYSVFRDSYWSPLNLSTGTPLKLEIINPALLKKGVVEGRVPKEKLHFGSKQTKTYNLDLTKMLWNASMGSDWPCWNLFEVVPKGVYSLAFEIGSTPSATSNAVTVTIA